jgi:hypothetical protein
MLSGVSWVDTHTVRLSPGPTLGKNVKILVMPGALTGYLLRGGGLAMTGPLDMGGNPIVNVGAGGTGTSVAQRQELNLSSVLAGYLLKAGGTMSGVLNMGGNKIQGVADGVAATDAASVGQVNNHTPAGLVSAFAGSVIPSGWLLCNGAAISRTDYARLFGVIGVSHGSGDATTTFNVPNYMGYFLRGLDTTGLIDPGGASRSVGNVQGFATGPHQHPSVWRQGCAGDGGPPYGWNVGGTVQDSSKIPENTVAETGSATETRPKNVAVNYIIKT